MILNYEKPESVVIVRNEFGAVATIRYKNKSKDKIVSSSSDKPASIYFMIEDAVTGRTRNDKAKR